MYLFCQIIFISKFLNFQKFAESVYEKHSPFPEVKAADCIFFITFQMFWVNYADNHFLGNLFSCADNLDFFMNKKI
jgi:hypothetical protein